MSRIEQTFADLKASGRAAFMPYLTAGDPDLGTTKQLILAMAEAGADLIELGIPFSDPIADGPTIQRANERALAGGTTVDGILQVIREVRETSQVPIMLMGSYNPIFVRGVEAFCKDAADAGVDGFIIPDLLPDQSAEIKEAAAANGLDTIYLIAPTSTDARLKLVGEESTGFVYAVSLTGVTGEREALPEELADFVKHAREFIQQPICVGFGISTPVMAKEVSAIADGVIIGSAVVKRIAAACEAGEDPCVPVADFVKEISGALAK